MYIELRVARECQPWIRSRANSRIDKISRRLDDRCHTSHCSMNNEDRQMSAVPKFMWDKNRPALDYKDVSKLQQLKFDILSGCKFDAN